MTSDSTHTADENQQPAAESAAALERVFAVVYDELRRLAHRQLQREPAGLTLRTTDLVHEAYLRLADQHSAHLKSRAHFPPFAASTGIQRILGFARHLPAFG